MLHFFVTPFWLLCVHIFSFVSIFWCHSPLFLNWLADLFLLSWLYFSISIASQLLLQIPCFRVCVLLNFSKYVMFNSICLDWIVVLCSFELIWHLLTAFSIFSHFNYPLSLHGKTNLYDKRTLNETNAVCWNSCFAKKICASKHTINLKMLID